MVKNSGGGGNAKKMGRKYAVDEKKTRLRLSSDPAEMYGVVDKVYGNGMCSVKTVEGVEYLCHIRNKFRGRSKRDNLVAVNVWLLIGARVWSSACSDVGSGKTTRPSKRPEADLLEVYSSRECEELILRGIITANASSGSSYLDTFDFGENVDASGDPLLGSMDSSNSDKIRSANTSSFIDIDNI